MSVCLINKLNDVFFVADNMNKKSKKSDKRLSEVFKIYAQTCLNVERNRNIVGTRIAIIGGGIAGTVAALHLARVGGITVDLFEKENAIFKMSSAIPAHLYSGVQYFDDIDKKSIQHCMRDAIAFARTLPFCINPRPTVMAIAKKDSRRPEGLEEACIMNQKVYASECVKNPQNRVFGDPSSFYKKYTREQIDQLLEKGASELLGDDRWVVSFAKETNLDDLKFPIFLIREYGLDMRHAGGFIEQLIKEDSNIRLHTHADVSKVSRIAHGVEISGVKSERAFTGNYHAVVDASGRQLGKLESQLNVRNPRMVDIKLAGLFKLGIGNSVEECLPEIYILGGKGYAPGTSFMSHISPINPAGNGGERWMVVNVTMPNCTYVSDGKKSNGGMGPVDINAQDNPVAMQVLKDEKSHLPRLCNMVEMLRHRHEKLAGNLQPVCGIPGSVDILGGNIAGRDSGINAHANKRFISLNITKGGAAVSVAQSLVGELYKNQRDYEMTLKQKPQKITFIPKDVLSAVGLTKDRYRKLGFSESSSKTFLYC